MRTISCLLPLLALQASQAAPAAGFRIVALSNRPDKVSGGNLLVRVEAPSGEAVLLRNGEDVTAALRPEGDTLMGLVEGLLPGANSLEVFRKGGAAPEASLTVTNFPLTGPVFSGPQEQPYICQTESFKLPDGSLLGPPLDGQCSVRTVVTYVYRSGAAWKPLPDRTALPADVAWTTTSTGVKAPFIVRVETGTVNRAIYQIAILHDPASEAPPHPFAPPKGWNRRLLYTFGGGCVGGWYRQGASVGTTLDAAILAKGYASASASLNVFGNNCQDVTAAETMMMVKEHFIETFGPPLFTFGRGGSGGSYQQNQIADGYPGLLDGIIPSATFPDVLATIQFLTDAQLLTNYFGKGGDTLSEKQKLAIAGVGHLSAVTGTAGSAGRINPTRFCPAELPETLRYHPVERPEGARCDVFDHTVNVYGRDPATGFARRPVDNVGVQYGLAALNEGVITTARFLDLNERIGGYDQDGNPAPARATADREALRAAYRTGRVTHGGGGLARIPIIDLRRYSDLRPKGDVHLRYHSFSLRARLERANGTAANEVMLVGGDTPRGVLEDYAIAKMDEWLTTLAQDTGPGDALVKVLRARPADLTDACFTATGERINETQTFGGGACHQLYPAFPSPRMVAGSPIAGDVLKCALKPVDFSDYRVSFTDPEKDRLHKIFPEGVCDWSRPGIEQQALAGSWLTY